MAEAAVRPFRLYHATSLDRLYEILDSDELSANTAHRIDAASAQDRAYRPTDADYRGYVHGVSLTRNPRFASRWQSRATTGHSVVLVLDGDAIRRRFRILPVAFWAGRHTRYPPGGPAGSDESEEFVIGSIKPLKPYLIEVRVTRRALESDEVLKTAAELFDFNLVVVDGSKPQFG